MLGISSCLPWPGNLTIHNDTLPVQCEIQQLSTILCHPKEFLIDSNSVHSPSQWWEVTQGIYPCVVAVGDRPEKAQRMKRGVSYSTFIIYSLWLFSFLENFVQQCQHSVPALSDTGISCIILLLCTRNVARPKWVFCITFLWRFCDHCVRRQKDFTS